MAKLSFHKTQFSDLDFILSMENDPENAPFICKNSKEEHHNLINDSDAEHFIIKANEDKIIGYIILAGLKSKNNSIELRRIVIQHKEKGYGRLALQRIKQFCFEKFKCHRLWLDVLVSNERARHLYQSEGFQQEGVFRESMLIDGQYVDQIIMSILKQEYQYL